MRALLLAALPLAAQDYFPLHVNNQWVYRFSGAIAPAPVVVDIPAASTLNGRLYHQLRGLTPEPVWLRQSEDGTLYRYEPASQTETVWAVFATPAGETYRTGIDPCNGTARVESRNAKVRVPAGDFEGALSVSYPAANCADAGLTADAFLPYIGLVQRSSTTIAGPRTMSLAYARVGGVTVLEEPVTGFSVALSAPDASRRAITARLTIRSTVEPLDLTFPSGQRFDAVLKNGPGDILYRWSDGKAFTLALGTERIAGERNWIVEIPLVLKDSSTLPAGRYHIEAWLTTIAEKQYGASASFELPAR